jgi:dipeptidase D
MNILRLTTLLVVASLLATACAPVAMMPSAPAAPPPPPAIDLSSLVIAPDIAARVAKLKPIDISQTLDLSGLTDWEKAVLDKLLQAAYLIDAAYWQQSDPQGAEIYKALAGATDPKLQDARFLIGVYFGRWDRFKDFEPFVGTEPRPVGSFLYPPDLTRAELDQYIVDHSDEKDALLSSYTVIRREGDKLIAVPYHEAYAQYFLPAADLLDEAAALSQDPWLTSYLKLQAQGLRSDDYYQADLEWVAVSSSLDLTLGPVEVYDDRLTGQKTSLQANIQVVDRAATATLQKFTDAVPALQARLPVPAAFHPDQTGTLTPMEIVQEVYRAGQMRAGTMYAAYSLPNDPRVWKAKGVKKVIIRNFSEARRLTVLTPLVHVVLDEATAQKITADAYFNWLLMHEVSHSLGPGTIEKDGAEITVRQALAEFYSPIEEGKADITGLYNVPYLLEQGVISGALESHYVAFLSEALRSARLGFGSPYGVIRSAAWNYFVEQGALSFDSASGRFLMDADKMTAAVESLMIKILTIEGEGDTQGAKAFIDQYAHIAPELQTLLDKADETVPVEFVPTFSSLPNAPQVAPVTAPAAAERVPLKEAMQTLEPAAVWKDFYAVTQVPRPSHHEEQISQFMLKFGQSLGLETIQDEVGNVLIREPATPGMESRQGVVLQAHIDMVAQKTADKVHDFLKDPIDAYVEGGWVKADGTTLGADDGSGVAIIMAILESKEIAHGPIEALFTVNEEDGFGGVNAVKPDLLQGRIFINIDWETQGSFGISSAGGVYVDALAKYAEEPAAAGNVGYTIAVKGLLGGHSGVDINKGRGSASKLLVRLLYTAPEELGLRVASLVGGDRSNAIPREASAVVTVPPAQAEALAQYVQEFAATVQNELGAVETGITATATPGDLPAAVMETKAQKTLLGAIYGGFNGVARMSDAVPGLVESSGNMGILTIGKGEMKVNHYVRSAIDSARDDVANRIAAVYRLAGAEATIQGQYSGWKPNPASPILGLMRKVYKEQSGEDVALEAVHAGLETSVIGAKYPQMDMISVGPTLIDVHSPVERMDVASVAKVYDLLVETLKEIPSK